jgi:hypothetical protein
MIIINSLLNNFKRFMVHFWIFLFKSGITYIAFYPLKRTMEAYFRARTINENMLLENDPSALFEFFFYNYKDGIGTITNSVFLLFLLFFIIDAFVDAGMVRALREKSNKVFFDGMKSNGWSFFGLKLLNLFPFALMLFIMGISLNSLLPNDLTKINIIIVLLLSGIPSLFFLKMIDSAKIFIDRDGKSVGRAFQSALFSFFHNWKKALELNASVLALLGIGIFVFFSVDDRMTISSSSATWMMVLIQQIALFLKQILRYIFMDGVLEIMPKMEK